MAEIKRANYFTSQFLEEEDFNDEQAYHLSSRRRHNRVLHTSGVVDGLDVTLVSGTQIQVGAGSAVDKDGREIVLADPQIYKLATAGADLDVYLTIAYQEVFDPADQDTQGLGKFERTTERPLLQDGTAVPPTDGSVIVLARIHLNSAGAIVSSGIDATLRTLGGAKVTPNAINTPQLADGAVKLVKLAIEVRPFSLQAAAGTAITVGTDTLLKRITVGETHSARSDNPHGTTAAQIDNQGGANRLVTQINSGASVITRSHVERAIASGVVTFEVVPFNSVEVFSDEIDAGFGPGAVKVRFALDDVPASVGSSQVTAGSDTGYGRAILFRSEVDRTTGRFRIFATGGASGAGQTKVRWFASRPAAGPDANVAISVTVSPSTASVTSSKTQGFTAKINNANIGGVAWSLLPPVPANGVGPGTLSNITATSVTYTPPGISGTYTIVATVFDPTKTGSANITVNGDPLVTVSPSSPSVLGGATQSLSATVVNSANTGVTWSIREGTGNGTLTVSGNNATYAAPATPGTYHVDAASVVNATKIGTAAITVPPPTISVTPTSANVIGGATLNVGAIVGNTNVTGVTWSASGGTVSPTTGNNATYTAPTTPGSYTVTAKSVADSTKTATCAITVPAVAISIQADANPVQTSSSTTLTAIITGTNDHRATWVGSASGSVSPTLGNTTTFLAPSVASNYTVTATSVADTSKSVTITMDVQDGTSKVIADNVDPSSFVSTSDQLLSPTGQTDTSAEARSFVRPKKRSAPKPPRKPKQ